MTVRKNVVFLQSESWKKVALCCVEKLTKYSSTKKSKHELDFVLPAEEGIQIVEVKSGSNFRHHASLDYALAHSHSIISEAIVLCNSNVVLANGIRYLPLYMAMFL
jgi:hypothetical protein